MTEPTRGERVEMEISRMRVDQIREAFLHEVFAPIDPKRDRMDEVIRLATVFAAVAHRLANTPRARPDPDASAKAAAWTWWQGAFPGASTYRDRDEHWNRSVGEPSRNGWRAVVAGRGQADG